MPRRTLRCVTIAVRLLIAGSRLLSHLDQSQNRLALAQKAVSLIDISIYVEASIESCEYTRQGLPFAHWISRL